MGSTIDEAIKNAFEYIHFANIVKSQYGTEEFNKIIKPDMNDLWQLWLNAKKEVDKKFK